MQTFTDYSFGSTNKLPEYKELKTAAKTGLAVQDKKL
jgi:hypothetical protein